VRADFPHCAAAIVYTRKVIDQEAAMSAPSAIESITLGVMCAVASARDVDTHAPL
jgi:hypothetical protein